MVKDPNNSNTYYAGAPAGGFWKSTDGGATWGSTTTDNLPQIGVSGIALDPDDSNIIYIATGDDDAGDSNSVGVMKSTDGWLTWNTTGLNAGNSPTRMNDIYIVKDQANPALKTILVATNNGVRKSTNDGVSWSFATGVSGNIRDIKIKPGSSSVVYAAKSSALFKSTNMGSSFTQVSNGIPTTGSNRLAIDVTNANPEYVYVLSAGSDNSYRAIYRSTNSGGSFTEVSNQAQDTDVFESSQSWYDMAFAVSDTNPNEFYTGVLNIWKGIYNPTTSDTQFTRLNEWNADTQPSYTHADIHFLRFFEGELLAGTDGGFYKSTNGGTSFTDLTAGMQISQFYRISVAKTRSDRIAGGLQDNGGYGLNNGQWQNYYGADGMEAIVDPANASKYYGFTQYGGSLYMSSNAGGSRSFITTAPEAEKGTNDSGGEWITPLFMNSDSELYAAYSRLYRLQGNSWVVVSPSFGSDADVLEIDDLNPDNIYVANGSVLRKSTNRGVSFSTISVPGSGDIRSVEVNSSDSNTFYVIRGTSVYKTTNGGSSFSNISTGLPSSLAKMMIKHQDLHPKNPLFIGTALGVYRYDDATLAWELFNNGLPNVSVRDIDINVVDNKITAATYGRGIWQSDIPTELASTVVDLSATTYHYDLGTPNSAVLAGFTRVSENTFGDVNWSATVESRDRGTSGGANDINRDLILSDQKITFNHKISNGIWKVKMNMGDADVSRDNMSVTAEGIVLNGDVNSPANVFTEVNVNVPVTDGELNIEVDDLGGSSPKWSWNRLSLIYQGPAPQVINVDLSATRYDYDLGTPNSPVFKGYTRISENVAGDVTWSGVVDSRDRGTGTGANDNNRDFIFSDQPRTLNHTIANGIWKVIINMGDADNPHEDMTVKAEGAIIAADVDSATGVYSSVNQYVIVSDGELNIEIDDVGGADPNWVANRLSLIYQGPAPDVMNVDLTATRYDYDLGGVDSPVFNGYTGIHGNITGDITWSGTIDFRDRGTGSGANDINRDFVLSDQSRTFNHKIANGAWRIIINMGDSNGPHDDMTVTAEGAVIAADVDSAAGVYTYVNQNVTVTDGELNIEVDDVGGSDPNWVWNRLSLIRIPEIAFSNALASITEESDCDFTDVSIPVTIGTTATADVIATFAVTGGSALNGKDYSLMTPSVTFASGTTTTQNMIIRVYHDNFVEGNEDITIDFAVNANGGDAIAGANTLTFTINDDNIVPGAGVTNIQSMVSTANDPINLSWGGTIYATDPISDNLMLRVANNNTFDYGCVDMSVSRAGTAAQSYNSSTGANHVMDKTFTISSTNGTTSGSNDITFYFTEAEIAGWETATGLSRNDLSALRTTDYETVDLTIGAFGTDVTLTGSFTGLDGDFYFGHPDAFKVLLLPKIFLQGAALNPNAGEENLMRDDLRIKSLISTTSPYADGATCNASVFNVTGANAIVDWVLVELRDATTNTSIISSKSGLLQRDGDIVDADGTTAVQFNHPGKDYYIAIKHRNHMGIMTNAISALTSTASVLDLSNATSSVAFGTNPMSNFGMPPNVIGMWAGKTGTDTKLSYLGSNNDSNVIKDAVLANPGNTSNSNLYAFDAYSNADTNMDGTIRYQGANNDVNIIKDVVLSNLDNTGSSPNLYIFTEQLPEN